MLGTTNKVTSTNNCVKIKCPKCKGLAELEADFSFVKCQSCDLEMSYGEYVKFVAHNDVTYSDILGDYAGTTAGQNAGTLDEWD
jgi:predicted RNA-binding Zn-ribbon protein involved in translation (DUF1610 family)